MCLFIKFIESAEECGLEIILGQGYFGDFILKILQLMSKKHENSTFWILKLSSKYFYDNFLSGDGIFWLSIGTKIFF